MESPATTRVEAITRGSREDAYRETEDADPENPVVVAPSRSSRKTNGTAHARR